MHSQILCHAMVLCGCVSMSIAQRDAEPPVQVNGSIQGRVSDAEHNGTPGVTVVLCDATTGVPVTHADWTPFPKAETSITTRMSQIATAITTPDGSFEFNGVAPGDYRLITQSWPDAPNAQSPLDVNGVTVQLHGVSEAFTLDPGETESLDLAPLGACTLIIEDLAANDETLVLVSVAPLSADPILGFAGWTGPFMQQMIGGNRMPEGQTVFTGLPEGVVYLATFSADNIPGYGAATVTLAPQTPMVVDIPFVVTWSDGVHSPPPDLETLTAKIAELGDPIIQRIMSTYQGELKPGQNPLFALANLGEKLDVEFEFPDGSTEPMNRVVTALAYVMMQRSLQRNGRQPNPYRPAAIRPARADEIPSP